MKNLQTRQNNADKALAEFDFEPNQVENTTHWNTDDDHHDEWTCILNIKGYLIHYKAAFIVRFIPNTNNVLEAYQGDPH